MENEKLKAVIQKFLPEAEINDGAQFPEVTVEKEKTCGFCPVSERE